MNVVGLPSALEEESIPPANVLVVDDVPQNLVAMQALLRSEGVHVLTASSGAQALELLLLHDVAVAILDVHMPEMSGFTLAELMRGSPRTSAIPIIFLTASPQDPGRAFEGYDAGAVDFLHKPIEPHVIRGKVAVFVELHRQRQLLAMRAQRLEQALSLNETMLAVMTHDLRTPLSVVSLCSNALVRLPASPEIHTLGQRIERSASRMATMIDQLLEFSRIRSGVLRLEPQPADLSVVTQQVVDEMRHAHPEQAMTLDTVGSMNGVFDPGRIAQVLCNVLGNAVRHAREGSVEVRLDGTLADRLQIRISNAGQIDEALLPRLFEPFKGMLHASSGLGLGLYIVDQFVRAHGGVAAARNEAGQVVVSIDLPRHARCAL